MQLEGLNTKALGRECVFYQEIDSTQLEIIRQIKKQAIKHGSMVIANIQTKGIRNSWEKMVY